MEAVQSDRTGRKTTSGVYRYDMEAVDRGWGCQGMETEARESFQERRSIRRGRGRRGGKSGDARAVGDIG